jgi:2'-5' RNA ligase
MAYAVELMVDAEAAGPIKALWRQIYAACGGLAADTESSPHISLAAFELGPNLDSDLAQASALLADFAAETAALQSRFQAVAAFPTEQRVLYLAPIVNRELLAAHAAFHIRLAQARIQGAAYYLPGSWIPHCTVAMQLPAGQLGPALELACRADVFRPFTLDAVRLIRIPQTQELVRYPLKSLALHSDHLRLQADDAEHPS